ncbi:LysE family translocator [Desulforhopalus singaporensis]|uniref:Threonine/homoserine/homoserine lactone efflux protein n=1 Tax=Desulforhopalus singaporensis TaxID=91360 RepID=A0A1H0RIP8_9BACT|nr:LysE family translocator [Desulforhopalus singaporensis]SDP29394.1 Threonine/homoserine/homoserine lactone efflux protein [Desulforhopalus singaporensis]
MQSPETLLMFFTASILLALAPGPDNLFVLTQSAQRGKLAGIAVTFGLCTGIIVHTMGVALGVAALFQASALAFNLLKYIGAGYLLYLAYLSFRTIGGTRAEQKTEKIPIRKLYRRGILMNVTNPKVSIFFLAFLPQFTDPTIGPLFPQFLLLGFLFIVTTILVFGGISLLAGSIGDYFRKSNRAENILNRMAGTVFVILAIKLALATRQ